MLNKMLWEDKSTNPACHVIYSSRNCFCVMGFYIQSALLSPFIPIEQWFSGRSSLAPRGHWAMSGCIFASHRSSRMGRCYRRLVGIGQRCCYTSCNAQDSVGNKEFIQPQMIIVLKLKRPALKSNSHHKVDTKP